MLRKLAWAVGVLPAVAVLFAAPVWACAGLVTASGNVKVLRTATLAAYHDGVEHYITSFEFAGGGAEFGSLVPLPGIPTKIERGGDWTLQRLQREVQPPSSGGGTASATDAARTSAPAEELAHERIDALDLTVLRGGAPAIAEWAGSHGFSLSPDAPEVLDYYAVRSPIFLAAVFDAGSADERGQQVGEGTPVHLTIPTDNPWVPLRILSLGRPDDELIDADVFLLTDDIPNLLPGPGAGLSLQRSTPASAQLLDDLRADKGMEWVPRRSHLSYLRLQEAASQIRYDLAVEADGDGRPSAVAAGLVAPTPPATTTSTTAPSPTTTDIVGGERVHDIAAFDVPEQDEPDRRPWLLVGVALIALPGAASLLARRLRVRR
jgi:hypothetical protein